MALGLRAPTGAARSTSGRTSATEPPLVAALRRVLAGAGLGTVAVRLRAGSVDLGGVPGGRLRALGKALAAAKLPVP